MGLDLSKIHEVQVDEKGRQAVIERRATMRFSHQGQTAIVVQGGKFWADNGDPIDEVPDWAAAKVRKLAKRMKEKLGLKLEDWPEPEGEAPSRRSRSVKED